VFKQVVTTAKAPSSFLTLEKLAMKKTLIALAVLAASGASFAQSSVTISGAVGFGYSKDATTKGYEMTDGNVQFTAKEDLGGGMAVVGAVKLDSLFGRAQTNPTNADATLTFTNGALSLMGGSFESTADARKGDVSGISLEQGLDKADYNLATTNVDGIVVSYALMPGVTIGASHAEVTPLGDATATTKTTKISASYANGPLTVFFSNGKLSTAGAKPNSNFAVTYDLGVAKVGMGMRTKGDGLDSTTLFSAAVPVGAFNFGIATAEYNGVRGTVVGANYSLSKTTTVYVSRQQSDAAALDDSYRIKLVKAF
jgi:predicted porin